MQADNLAYVVGMELMHAAQGVELRSQIEGKLAAEKAGDGKDSKATVTAASAQQTPSHALNLQLGRSTRALFDAFRAKSAFFAVDRPLTPEVEVAKQFVLSYKP